MNHQINRLIDFALEKYLISEEDVDYSVNILLDVLHLDSFTREQNSSERLYECTAILDIIIEYAIENKLIENTQTCKDLFDTRIMNCIMPRPNEVISTFQLYYLESPKRATDYYYGLSIASNYIRKSRTDKNIRWKTYVKYGNIEISINLSKPEKDPKEIAMAKDSISSSYPKCLLCKENVGYSGDLLRPARQTHRIIPLMLENQKYYLQYSPYVYYNEHCIVFNQQHQNMVINHQTFNNLFSFLEQFPHYMIGSNADLPIVGGSILSHDHYQGGNYTFAIEEANVLKTLTFSKYKNTNIEVVKWPLSTIRITSNSKEEILELCDLTLQKWILYNAPSLDIISHTGDIRHNTITPIARMKHGRYQIDLVLRNNRTSETYPDGIFHPHPEFHHIKRENIGLIEVMGLAILPARLKDELELLKQCLLGEDRFENYSNLDKHLTWYQELKQEVITKETVDDFLRNAVTIKFVGVLENAGVFKMDEEGINAFISFVESLDREEK